ncbi:MAG: O-acetyl-ADP-ribose deacetylase [Bacteroidales bacterium]|nr:O-acetyl-ADP-ribose deacetylase [Bacteroidales bacterium]MCF8337664.1 O-acetyl-ADP-ribose deacetylase [Bacteroidales bacterium]
MKISVIRDDITRQEVDAIVNAANESLLGGGGMDGTIHRAAGPELKEECKTLDGCPTGEARVTKGYKLPTDFVIHTVGPVWKGGGQNEEQLLASCYHESLKKADERKLTSVAFPNISTGVYGFPKRKAAEVALKAVKEYREQNKTHIEKLVFVCFDEENYTIYNELLKED